MGGWDVLIHPAMQEGGALMRVTPVHRFRRVVFVLANLYQGTDGSDPAIDLAQVIYQELFA